jgi:hypothetical protein
MGRCLTIRELEAFANFEVAQVKPPEDIPVQAQRQNYLDHIGSCDSCSGEYATLREIASERFQK